MGIILIDCILKKEAWMDSLRAYETSQIIHLCLYNMPARVPECDDVREARDSH